MADETGGGSELAENRATTSWGETATVVAERISVDHWVEALRDLCSTWWWSGARMPVLPSLVPESWTTSSGGGGWSNWIFRGASWGTPREGRGGGGGGDRGGTRGDDRLATFSGRGGGGETTTGAVQVREDFLCCLEELRGVSEDGDRGATEWAFRVGEDVGRLLQHAAVCCSSMVSGGAEGVTVTVRGPFTLLGLLEHPVLRDALPESARRACADRILSTVFAADLSPRSKGGNHLVFPLRTSAHRWTVVLPAEEKQESFFPSCGEEREPEERFWSRVVAWCAAAGADVALVAASARPEKVSRLSATLLHRAPDEEFCERLARTDNVVWRIRLSAESSGDEEGRKSRGKEEEKEDEPGEPATVVIPRFAVLSSFSSPASWGSDTDDTDDTDDAAGRRSRWLRWFFAHIRGGGGEAGFAQELLVRQRIDNGHGSIHMFAFACLGGGGEKGKEGERNEVDGNDDDDGKDVVSPRNLSPRSPLVRNSCSPSQVGEL